MDRRCEHCWKVIPATQGHIALISEVQYRPPGHGKPDTCRSWRQDFHVECWTQFMLGTDGGQTMKREAGGPTSR